VAVSHRTAAWMENLLEQAPPMPIDLTTLSENRPRMDIKVHRCKLTRADVIEIDGLPITTPSRTLLDMATKPRYSLDRLIRRAAYLDLYNPADLAQTLDRAKYHRGARKLRRLLDALEEPACTGNELEDRLLTIVSRAGLPTPERQWEVAPYFLDFYWPSYRLNVETDGRDAHLNPVAFEADRERDTFLRLQGITVVRFTRKQVFFKADYVTSTLRRLLA
jgi:very-short-patch-repair endonuclease